MEANMNMHIFHAPHFSSVLARHNGLARPCCSGKQDPDCVTNMQSRSHKNTKFPQPSRYNAGWHGKSPLARCFYFLSCTSCCAKECAPNKQGTQANAAAWGRACQLWWTQGGCSHLLSSVAACLCCYLRSPSFLFLMRAHSIANPSPLSSNRRSYTSDKRGRLLPLTTCTAAGMR